jgi:hypothetical protein
MHLNALPYLAVPSRTTGIFVLRRFRRTGDLSRFADLSEEGDGRFLLEGFFFISQRERS